MSTFLLVQFGLYSRKDHCWGGFEGFGWTKVKNDTQVLANGQIHRGQLVQMLVLDTCITPFMTLLNKPYKNILI